MTHSLSLLSSGIVDNTRPPSFPNSQLRAMVSSWKKQATSISHLCHPNLHTEENKFEISASKSFQASCFTHPYSEREGSTPGMAQRILGAQSPSPQFFHGLEVPHWKRSREDQRLPPMPSTPLLKHGYHSERNMPQPWVLAPNISQEKLTLFPTECGKGQG